MRTGVVSVLILCAPLLELLVTRVNASPNPTNAAACSAPEYRQFDFWIGDWDAFDADEPTKAVARVKVDRILDGCVLHEDYQAATGAKGESFSIYDRTRKAWHQTWVTNRGQLLEIEGGLEAGEMILSGTERWVGRARVVRGTWKSVSGGVRETAVRSTDGGKTWAPWFDLMFRPRKSRD